MQNYAPSRTVVQTTLNYSYFVFERKESSRIKNRENARWIIERYDFELGRQEICGFLAYGKREANEVFNNIVKLLEK